MDVKEDHGLIVKQIEPWVRTNVAFPDALLHGKCNKVRLTHLSVDKKPQGDVRTFAVKLDEGAEHEIDPLLLQIADAAQKDCDDLSAGLQQYAIYAYFPSDTNYVPRKVFRVTPSDIEIERDTVPSEPANEKGLVAQAMRHLEAVMRTTTITNNMIVATMQNENARLATMNEKFSAQQVDFMILLQDLMDRSHSRRLHERSEEANIAMKESALSKVETLLPVIVNRIAGKTILPEQSKSFMLLSGLLEGLSPAQQEQLKSLLDPTQLIVLAEILEDYEKQKSKVLSGENTLAANLRRKNLPVAAEVVQTPAPRESPKSESVVDVAATPLPGTMKLTERMELARGPSRDPQIVKLETDAAAFQSRFADMLRPPKDKPPGEK